MEYPVGIAYYACGSGVRDALAVGLARTSTPRGGYSQAQLSAEPQVQRETLLFVAVNARRVRRCARCWPAWFLTGVHRRRPWDAALFALSPVLLF